jgi:hypothetical protein
MAMKQGMACCAIILAGSASAAELSLVSGFYRTESAESQGEDTGRKTVIDVAGRFSEVLDGPVFWYAEGSVSLKNYSRGAASAAPDSSTGIAAGGGLRYYFAKLSDSWAPYGLAYGRVQSEKDATYQVGGFTETDKNGLYYGTNFGIRLNLQREFFVDFETPLFKSALFATEKEETTTYGSPNTTSELTRKKTELYVNSAGAFSDVLVALGMRF